MSPAARGTQQFCPNCGAKVTKTAKFCRECGQALQEGAEATEQLATAPPATPPKRRSGSASAATTRKLPPPSPPPPAAIPPPAAPAKPAVASTFAWPAWVGAGACGVLVIALGLSWFGGGFSVDGFDLPFAALFSDSAQGGLPFGVLFILVAVAGLGTALINPEARLLSMTFVIAGAIATFFLLWYMVRVLSNLSGTGLFDALSIGFWLAFLSSLAILASGIAVRTGAGVRQPA